MVDSPAAEVPFLVVDFDGGDLVFAKLTRDVPGATVDMASEPHEGPAGKAHHTAFLVNGIDGAVRARLEADLTRRYEAPTTVRWAPGAGQWLATIRMRFAAMPGGGAGVFGSVAPHVRPPSCHIVHGRLLWRAEVRDPATAQHWLEYLTQALADRDVGARVALQYARRASPTLQRALAGMVPPP